MANDDTRIRSNLGRHLRTIRKVSYTPSSAPTASLLCRITSVIVAMTAPKRTLGDIMSSRPNFDEWLAEPPPVSDWAKSFFAEYVGITDEKELIRHLMEVRDSAWKVYQYRCVASFHFINYNLEEAYGTEFYQRVLQRVKNDELFLDLGCAFGHVARNLVFAGVPQKNIISADLRQEFWDLGFQLYGDPDKFHGTFCKGDIFDPKYLEEYDGKVNIVHASAFFHLFDLEHQELLIRRLLRLVSKNPGTVIFGRQAGNTIPWHRKHPFRNEQVYQHSGESFKKFLQDEAGEGWEAKTWFRARPEDVATNGGLHGRLIFMLTKL
jgi:hypothetical protein